MIRTAPVGTVAGVKCRRCGHENEPGANFCSSCGTPLSGDEETTLTLAAIEDRQALEEELFRRLCAQVAGEASTIRAAAAAVAQIDVAAGLAGRFLPRVRAGRGARLDLVGAAGVAVSLALVLVPLTLGHGAGWPAWTWVCLGLAVPGLGLTGWWLRALRARGGQPVLDPALLRVRSYVAGLGSNVAFLLYFGSFMFTLTLLLQGELMSRG